MGRDVASTSLQRNRKFIEEVVGYIVPCCPLCHGNPRNTILGELE